VQLRARALDQCQQFRVGNGRRFTGGAADQYAAGARFQMHREQSLPRRPVDSAIHMHWRHNRDHAAGEHIVLLNY
jgi:hypothetical protein